MLKKMKQVKVGPFNFKFVYGYSTESRKKAPYPDAMGFVVFDDLEICVSDEQSKGVAEETTVHEVLHAIFWVTGMSKLIDDHDKEELIVRAVSPLLVDVVRSNKDFANILLGKEAL